MKLTARTFTGFALWLVSAGSMAMILAASHAGARACLFSYGLLVTGTGAGMLTGIVMQERGKKR